MGTHVGDNVIIGAGAVCSGNLESDSVYAGNPAKRVCSLQEFNEKCASQYVESAKEYAGAMKSSLGRIPNVDEMYAGYLPLFQKEYQGYVPNCKFPKFESVSELLMFDTEKREN